MLARVCGLSRLGYLNPHQRQIQVSAGLELIETLPGNIIEMVNRFADILAEETGNNP
jgi:hypothetical protein